MAIIRSMDICDILRHYTTLRVAAQALGVSRQTLYNWQRHGIPCAAQIQVEMQTDGAIKADPACTRTGLTPWESGR